MSTIDPTFTIGGSATGVDAETSQMVGVAVTKNTTVNFAIVDPAGIKSATWEVVGLSADFTSPTITASGTPSGVTASCTCPNQDGIAVGVMCRATSSTGAISTHVGFFYTVDGDFIPFFDGMTNWGHQLVAMLAAAGISTGGGGGSNQEFLHVPSYSGDQGNVENSFLGAFTLATAADGRVTLRLWESDPTAAEATFTIADQSYDLHYDIVLSFPERGSENSITIGNATRFVNPAALIGGYGILSAASSATYAYVFTYDGTTATGDSDTISKGAPLVWDTNVRLDSGSPRSLLAITATGVTASEPRRMIMRNGTFYANQLECDGAFTLHFYGGTLAAGAINDTGSHGQPLIVHTYGVDPGDTIANIASNWGGTVTEVRHDRADRTVRTETTSGAVVGSSGATKSVAIDSSTQGYIEAWVHVNSGSSTTEYASARRVFFSKFGSTCVILNGSGAGESIWDMGTANWSFECDVTSNNVRFILVNDTANTRGYRFTTQLHAQLV